MPRHDQKPPSRHPPDTSEATSPGLRGWPSLSTGETTTSNLQSDPFLESSLSITLIKLSWKPYHVSQESKQACKNTWAGKSLAARSPLEHAAEAIEGPHALHPPRRAPRPYFLQPCKASPMVAKQKGSTSLTETESKKSISSWRGRTTKPNP